MFVPSRAFTFWLFLQLSKMLKTPVLVWPVDIFAIQAGNG
jgi:hypothetical protein